AGYWTVYVENQFVRRSPERGNLIEFRKPGTRFALHEIQIISIRRECKSLDVSDPWSHHLARPACAELSPPDGGLSLLVGNIGEPFSVRRNCSAVGGTGRGYRRDRHLRE